MIFKKATYDVFGRLFTLVLLLLILGAALVGASLNNARVGFGAFLMSIYRTIRDSRSKP